MPVCMGLAAVCWGIMLATSVFGGEPAAGSPLVLSLRSHGLFQETIVAENRDFYLSSEIRGSRWIIRGKAGEIKEEKIVVEIESEFGASDRREKITQSFELTVNAAEARSYGGGGGSTIGDVAISALWIRRGVDPWPALLNGLSKRGVRNWRCRQASIA